MPGSEGAGYQGCSGSCSQQTMRGHSGPVFSHNSPCLCPPVGPCWPWQTSRAAEGLPLQWNSPESHRLLNKRAGSFSPASSICLPAPGPKTGLKQDCRLQAPSCRLQAPRSTRGPGSAPCAPGMLGPAGHGGDSHRPHFSHSFPLFIQPGSSQAPVGSSRWACSPTGSSVCTTLGCPPRGKNRELWRKDVLETVPFSGASEDNYLVLGMQSWLWALVPLWQRGRVGDGLLSGGPDRF